MSKILLSFLGTGPRNIYSGISDIGTATRSYLKTDYSLDGKIYSNQSFVSLAIANHHAIDKIFMIGTPKSMWEEVYRTFYNKSHNTEDSLEELKDKDSVQIWDNIFEHSKEADHLSSLDIPHKEVIENLMGKGSKVILIKYGINEEEIRENISLILQLEQFLEQGDELIVDITHAFRSLPVLIMNLLIYLKNVSTKNIIISHIYYGMNEVKGELNNISPIVDLKTLLELQDWITGAYSMKEFGNSYKVAELLRKQKQSSENDKGIASHLETFSDYVNLNYMDSMMKVIQNLSGIKGKCENELAKLVVNPVIEDFLNKFKGKHITDSAFLYRLSNWLFTNKKYAQSYLTALEALISYAAEKSDFKIREIRTINFNKKNEVKFIYVKDGREWDSYTLRKTIPLILQKNLFKGNRKITEEEYYYDNIRNIPDTSKTQDEKYSLLLDLDQGLDNDPVRKIYSSLNRHRNQVAHLITSRNDGSTFSSKEIIKSLKENLTELRKIIK